ncbi:MAG TPA: hypothetical protein VN704_05745, partial [Verrucomicrobiae bacterium]|nr:hypothetical protein [Verrucomicrobiae bacterium]
TNDNTTIRNNNQIPLSSISISLHPLNSSLGSNESVSEYDKGDLTLDLKTSNIYFKREQKGLQIILLWDTTWVYVLFSAY